MPPLAGHRASLCDGAPLPQRNGKATRRGSSHPQNVETLPPRLRRALQRVLRGESEKEIARHLRLSQHTVHEYVGELYRRFGVCSRAELMAKWVGHSG